MVQSAPGGPALVTASTDYLNLTLRDAAARVREANRMNYGDDFTEMRWQRLAATLADLGAALADLVEDIEIRTPLGGGGVARTRPTGQGEVVHALQVMARSVDTRPRRP
jgi:hypothetical protein